MVSVNLTFFFKVLINILLIFPKIKSIVNNQIIWRRWGVRSELIYLFIYSCPSAKGYLLYQLNLRLQTLSLQTQNNVHVSPLCPFLSPFVNKSVVSRVWRSLVNGFEWLRPLWILLPNREAVQMEGMSSVGSARQENTRRWMALTVKKNFFMLTLTSYVWYIFYRVFNIYCFFFLLLLMSWCCLGLTSATIKRNKNSNKW